MLAKADAEAAKLRERIIVQEQALQLERQKKVASLSQEKRAVMEDTFYKLFNPNRSGKVLPVDLKRVAANLDVIYTDNMISDLFHVFDVDKDGALSLEEFALWWTCGWSTLHQAVKQRELHDAVAAQASENRGPLPSWKPTITLQGDVTVGEVAEGYQPKASIMATVLPCTPQDYVESLKANLKAMENEDDEDENPPKAEVKSTPVFAQLFAGVRKEATDEDVEQCLEVLKAVLEEHSEQEDIPGAAKLRLVDEGGKRQFHFTFYVRADKGGEEMPTEGPLAGVMAGVQMASAMSEGEFSNLQAFEQVLAGVDFGVDPFRVLSLTSTTPLITLLQSLRVFVKADYNEAAIDMARLQVIRKVLNSGEDWKRKRVLRKMTQHIIPPGAVRDLSISASFDTPHECLQHAIRLLCEVPDSLANKYYPKIRPEQRQALAEEVERLRTSITALVQSKLPTDSSMLSLTAAPGLRKFVDTPKNIPKIGFICAPGVSKSTEISQLVESTTFTQHEGPVNVKVGTLNKKQVLWLDINTGSHYTLPGLRLTSLIFFIESVAQVKFVSDVLLSCSDEAPKVLIVSSIPDDALKTAIASSRIAPLSASIRTGSKISEESHAFLLQNDDPRTESDDEDEGDGEGSELIKQIMSSVQKAIGSIDDIFVTTVAADVHVHLEGISIADLLPASTGELALARAQGKALFGGVARSSATIQSLRRIQDLVEKQIDEYDVSSDDEQSSQENVDEPRWDFNSDDDRPAARDEVEAPVRRQTSFSSSSETSEC